MLVLVNPSYKPALPVPGDPNSAAFAGTGRGWADLKTWSHQGGLGGLGLHCLPPCVFLGCKAASHFGGYDNRGGLTGPLYE